MSHKGRFSLCRQLPSIWTVKASETNYVGDASSGSHTTTIRTLPDHLLMLPPSSWLIKCYMAHLSQMHVWPWLGSTLLTLNMCQWRSNITHVNKHVVMSAQLVGTLGNIIKSVCYTSTFWELRNSTLMEGCWRSANQVSASLCYSATRITLA